MFAYIDETGNTGHKLWDSDQPKFALAAIVTKTNFDILNQYRFRRLANGLGEASLHASHLGADRLEEVSDELLKIWKKADGRLVLAEVVKSDLALMKLADTIFDPGENAAMPWHVYWSRPLRLLLVAKLSKMTDMELLQNFWTALQEKKKDRSVKLFLDVLEILVGRLDRLDHDPRAQQLIGEGVQWALMHPDNIGLHIAQDAARKGHAPHLAVFPQVLSEIDKLSKTWRRSVNQIVHDRQSQFGGVLRHWHKQFAEAPKSHIKLLGGERINLSLASGSTFIIKAQHESPGIQMADIFLWLYRADPAVLGPKAWKLLKHTSMQVRYYELSMRSIYEMAGSMAADLEINSITNEEIERGSKAIETAEGFRLHAMARA